MREASRRRRYRPHFGNGKLRLYSLLCHFLRDLTFPILRVWPPDWALQLPDDRSYDSGEIDQVVWVAFALAVNLRNFDQETIFHHVRLAICELITGSIDLSGDTFPPTNPFSTNLKFRSA